MKKIYFLMLFVCSSMLVLADGLTATLQHGETMTAYFGQSALTEAYEAAADGDVITLSAGGFNPVAEIKKSVRIVGAYGVTNESYATFLNAAFTVNADNVKLEGMYFQGDVTLAEIKNCIIKRCHINLLRQSGAHTNTLIDQCVLMYDYAVKTGINYGIKNTTINNFAAMNTVENVAYITNCMIWFFQKRNDPHYYQPYAIYKNNILVQDVFTSSKGMAVIDLLNCKLVLKSPSEFYYNYFHTINTLNGYSSPMYYSFETGCVNTGNQRDESSSGSSISPSFPSRMGTRVGDNTVGILGGDGFNDYPGIPRIISSSVDAQTDDQGKLNASITVKAEK